MFRVGHMGLLKQAFWNIVGLNVIEVDVMRLGVMGPAIMVLVAMGHDYNVNV